MAQTHIKVTVGVRRWPFAVARIIAPFVFWWSDPIKDKIAHWLAERAVWVRDAD